MSIEEKANRDAGLKRNEDYSFQEEEAKERKKNVIEGERRVRSKKIERIDRHLTSGKTKPNFEKPLK